MSRKIHWIHDVTFYLNSRQIFWVYSVDNDEQYAFISKDARRVAEMMVYYLCVSAKKSYTIEELLHGFAILLNDKPLFWVRKERDSLIILE